MWLWIETSVCTANVMSNWIPKNETNFSTNREPINHTKVS
jgi:hypothetical protein